MEKKEALYIVFGAHTERVADYLKNQDYEVIGTDRTLDAAAIMATNLDEKPDAYLVLGSALVSGVVDAGINYGKALLDNLGKLRQAMPNSRIVLMLPEDAEPEVMQGIVYMGIYDIHKVKQISISQIPELLSQRKSYADYGISLPMPSKESNKSEIEIDDEEEKNAKRLPLKNLLDMIHNVINSLIARRKKHREVKNLTEEPCESKQQIIEKPRRVKEVKRQAGRKRVLCLGLESSQLARQGIEIVSDPEDAEIVLSDISSFYYATNDKELVVIGTGTVADFAITSSRPDAYVAKSIDDALVFISDTKRGEYEKGPRVEESTTKEPPVEVRPAEEPLDEEVTTIKPPVEEVTMKELPVEEEQAIETPVEKAGKEVNREKVVKRKKPNLTVLSSGRSGSGGHTISFNSALYVVCPSRPAVAGDMAAEISRKIDNCALVCAAPGSVGAISLGIPAKDLICNDWRVPRSEAPIKWNGILVWPVDPYKFLKINEPAHGLIENIKPKFPLVIVDCAGDLDIVSKASNRDGVIVLCDEADSTTSYWLQNYAGSNVFTGDVAGSTDVIVAENGFVLTKQATGKIPNVVN
jgi:hypothetical protein